jgi:hypothetical protein
MLASGNRRSSSTPAAPVSNCENHASTSTLFATVCNGFKASRVYTRSTVVEQRAIVSIVLTGIICQQVRTDRTPEVPVTGSRSGQARSSFVITQVVHNHLTNGRPSPHLSRRDALLLVGHTICSRQRTVL